MKNEAKGETVYGGEVIASDGTALRMYRRRQRVRFMDASGQQWGPEQKNVGPAIAYALSLGWQV